MLPEVSPTTAKELVSVCRTMPEISSIRAKQLGKVYRMMPEVSPRKAEQLGKVLASQCQKIPFALKRPSNIHLFSSRIWNPTFKKAKTKQTPAKIKAPIATLTGLVQSVMTFVRTQYNLTISNICSMKLERPSIEGGPTRLPILKQQSLSSKREMHGLKMH